MVRHKVEVCEFFFVWFLFTFFLFGLLSWCFLCEWLCFLCEWLLVVVVGGLIVCVGDDRDRRGLSPEFPDGVYVEGSDVNAVDLVDDVPS